METEPANSLIVGRFMMFDLKSSEEEMRGRFREKYGCEPDRLVKSGPIYFVGPIRGGDCGSSSEVVLREGTGQCGVE